MTKKYRIILISGIVVVVALVALVIVLLLDKKPATSQQQQQQLLPQPAEDQLQVAQQQVDSLEMANETIQLTYEFKEIDAEFKQYEGRDIKLKNDSLVRKYDESRKRIEQLIKELDAEKSLHGKTKEQIAQQREKIKQLEAEIGTLRGICKHYLEEIDRLNKENGELKEQNSQLTQRNEELSSQVSSQSQRNEELTQVVQRAEVLTVTHVSLKAYNGKGKDEKNVTKARQLGVSFTITPNNTAKAGMKDLYVRIISPEGSLLSGNGSFSFEGSQLPYTAKRSVEYTNDEVSTSVYWDVNTSLTPGEYTVEIFCDGKRLATRKFTLKK